MRRGPQRPAASPRRAACSSWPGTHTCARGSHAQPGKVQVGRVGLRFSTHGCCGMREHRSAALGPRCSGTQLGSPWRVAWCSHGPSPMSHPQTRWSTGWFTGLLRLWASPRPSRTATNSDSARPHMWQLRPSDKEPGIYRTLRQCSGHYLALTQVTFHIKLTIIILTPLTPPAFAHILVSYHKRPFRGGTVWPLEEEGPGLTTAGFPARVPVARGADPGCGQGPRPLHHHQCPLFEANSGGNSQYQGRVSSSLRGFLQFSRVSSLTRGLLFLLFVCFL